MSFASPGAFFNGGPAAPATSGRNQKMNTGSGAMSRYPPSAAPKLACPEYPYARTRRAGAAFGTVGAVPTVSVRKRRLAR